MGRTTMSETILVIVSAGSYIKLLLQDIERTLSGGIDGLEVQIWSTNVEMEVAC